MTFHISMQWQVRQGLLERDVENSYLAGEGMETGPMEQLLGPSITYRIAVGPQRGRKVFSLQCRRTGFH